MHTTVSIPGIHCNACETLIRDVSGEFPAITTIAVDLPAKKVTLEYEGGFNLADWSKAIGELGPAYRVQPA
ncbi:MAG: heavy metal-associated domain-containing protein [Patescibacteria group bacterium]